MNQVTLSTVEPHTVTFWPYVWSWKSGTEKWHGKERRGLNRKHIEEFFPGFATVAWSAACDNFNIQAPNISSTNSALGITAKPSKIPTARGMQRNPSNVFDAWLQFVTFVADPKSHVANSNVHRQSTASGLASQHDLRSSSSNVSNIWTKNVILMIYRSKGKVPI